MNKRGRPEKTSAVKGEGGLSSADKGGGEFFRYGHLYFLAQKTGFFEIYGVSARTRGLKHCRHFSGMGEGQFFAILYWRLLRTALYLEVCGKTESGEQWRSQKFLMEIWRGSRGRAPSLRRPLGVKLWVAGSKGVCLEGQSPQSLEAKECIWGGGSPTTGRFLQFFIKNTHVYAYFGQNKLKLIILK